MSQLPSSVLTELAGMDEYDRMLSLDRIARQHNMTVDQVEAQLQAFQSGGAMPVTDFEQVPEQNQQSPPTEGAHQTQYISDAHRYRVRYDPSQQGQTRQSQVEQAIQCPNCGAPLGIPAIRPIKVTCPNCMNETLFNN